jgi:hypothetical protein
MAESAFDFNSAPTGSIRQFGVLAGALGIKHSRSRSSGGGGLSARDQASLAREKATHESILSGQKHKQDIEFATHKAGLDRDNDTYGVAARHVVGQEASKQTHRQTMAQNRQQNKFDTQKDYQQRLFAGSESSANRAHEIEKQSQAHMQASDMHTLGMNAINTLAENKAVGSFKLPNGTSAQFNGVGEA